MHIVLRSTSYTDITVATPTRFLDNVLHFFRQCKTSMAMINCFSGHNCDTFFLPFTKLSVFILKEQWVKFNLKLLCKFATWNLFANMFIVIS